MILPILQILASLYLAIVVLNTLDAFEIKINIHTIPIAILSLLIMTFTIALSDKHPASYLGIGLANGIIFWILSSIKNGALPEYSKNQRLGLFIISVIFWPQVILFIIYYIKNYHKLKDYEGI